MENYSQQPTKQERRELRRQEKLNEQQQRKRKRLYGRLTLWSVVVLVILVLGGLGIYWFDFSPTEPRVRPELQCEIGKMTYYYRPECSWCQRIDREDTIDKIEELGVDVREVNTRTGSVPRFLIDNETYIGYRTFEQLKELLGC